MRKPSKAKRSRRMQAASPCLAEDAATENSAADGWGYSVIPAQPLFLLTRLSHKGTGEGERWKTLACLFGLSRALFVISSINTLTRRGHSQLPVCAQDGGHLKRSIIS
ncbi:hypothetical protein IF1G_05062 [Cordyceps javanica]|uniref:Uncharacterized protein n=1 Tax=Cordyceps javanica TaxID=43265 RepID=A0A545V436_9HYPO|nr:hypothetical protein IF1G_05062 [Cordyceps javanica]